VTPQDSHSSQTAKNVEDSYDSLVILFERIQFFLQRVNTFSESYTIRGQLWEVMAEALSTLAVSTNTMKETGFSLSISLIQSFRFD
jgi:hypothetical protein